MLKTLPTGTYEVGRFQTSLGQIWPGRKGSDTIGAMTINPYTMPARAVLPLVLRNHWKFDAVATNTCWRSAIRRRLAGETMPSSCIRT